MQTHSQALYEAQGILQNREQGLPKSEGVKNTTRKSTESVNLAS